MTAYGCRLSQSTHRPSARGVPHTAPTQGTLPNEGKAALEWAGQEHGRAAAHGAPIAARKRAASGGELPEAAVAAARPRDAKRRGRQESRIGHQGSGRQGVAVLLMPDA